MTEKDQELYQNFPLVISERWQAEVAETVFDTINAEADKAEAKKKTKHRKFDADEKGFATTPLPFHLISFFTLLHSGIPMNSSLKIEKKINQSMLTTIAPVQLILKNPKESFNSEFWISGAPKESLSLIN